MNAAEKEAAIGQQHTATLITEYQRAIAAGEIQADTAAKALLAAAAIISLQAAGREQVAAWLRVAAAAVERGGDVGRAN